MKAFILGLTLLWAATVIGTSDKEYIPCYKHVNCAKIVR